MVDDDGQGLSSDGRQGLGLLGIRERLGEFGGSLFLDVSELGGVGLRAKLPIDENCATMNG